MEDDVIRKVLEARSVCIVSAALIKIRTGLTFSRHQRVGHMSSIYICYLHKTEVSVAMLFQEFSHY